MRDTKTTSFDEFNMHFWWRWGSDPDWPCFQILKQIKLTTIALMSHSVFGRRGSAFVRMHSRTCKVIPLGRGPPRCDLGVDMHLGLDLAQQFALVEQRSHHIPRGKIRKVVHDVRQVDIC